jgi:hypothetical protein
MSTVSFQSPAFPTISHFPVTVTGAFDSLTELVFEFGLAAGVLAGLLAGAFELTVTFPEQPAAISPRDSATTNDTVFIICFLYAQISGVPD